MAGWIDHVGQGRFALRIVISGGSGVPQVFMDFGSAGLQAMTLRDALGAPLPTTAWVPGTYDVYFNIPAGAMAPGPSVKVRVRLSSAGGLLATGIAADGEVEDYIFPFAPTAVSLEAMSAERTSNLGAGLALVVLLGLALAGWRLSAVRAHGRA